MVNPEKLQYESSPSWYLRRLTQKSRGVSCHPWNLGWPVVEGASQMRYFAISKPSANVVPRYPAIDIFSRIPPPLESLDILKTKTKKIEVFLSYLPTDTFRVFRLPRSFRVPPADLPIFVFLLTSIWDFPLPMTFRDFYLPTTFNGHTAFLLKK